MITMPSTITPDNIAVLISFIVCANKTSWRFKNNCVCRLCYLMCFFLLYIPTNFERRSVFLLTKNLWRVSLIFHIHKQLKRNDTIGWILSNWGLNQNNITKYFFSFRKWRSLIFFRCAILYIFAKREKQKTVYQSSHRWLSDCDVD